MRWRRRSSRVSARSGRSVGSCSAAIHRAAWNRASMPWSRQRRQASRASMRRSPVDPHSCRRASPGRPVTPGPRPILVLTIIQAREGHPMFAQMEAVRLEALHFAHDPATGLRAVIAIHNTRLGPALGGCRFLAYADQDSAIRDAMRLAQGMSYKAALAGLAQGGGKAVIMRPPRLNDRGALFEAFGRVGASHGGRERKSVA